MPCPGRSKQRPTADIQLREMAAMTLDNLRSVALVGNVAERRVVDCITLLAPYLRHRGLRVLIDSKAVPVLKNEVLTPCAELQLAVSAELLIAIGGDGTLLRAAQLTVGRPIPLLGINLGRLGFLTDISPDALLEDVGSILDGRFIEDRRSMLEVRLMREGAEVGRRRALNDVVIQKSGTGRILDFETAIGGSFVSAHRGDGLIIATATGSTAYALSCGGPIVAPNLDVWVVAPICPHTLSDRPLLVSADSGIEVRLIEPGSQIQVSCDGQVMTTLNLGDRIDVRKAETHITLLHPPLYDYFELLRSKLHWGRGR